MNEELKAKLERYMPLYVAVRLEDNKVQGRIEHSFSLDWDDKLVRVWWSGKAYSILGEHMLSGEKDAKYNCNVHDHKQFVFDALSDDCPIEVNWEKWIAALEQQPGDKYRKRNAPFAVKPHGVYQLRALAAERELANLKPRFENVCKRNDELDDKLEKLNQILNPQEEMQDED